MSEFESPSLRRCVSLSAVLRAVSYVIAGLAYYFRPATPGIIAITSLKTFLLAPWYFGDVHYHVEFVRNRYQPRAPTANFHPLYPWLAILVDVVVREPLFS